MAGALLLSMLLAGAPPSAGEPAPLDQDLLDKERQTEVAQLAPAKAKLIELLVGGDDAKAALYGKPLLRWSNPTAGSVYGEVFLWTVDNRPAAIASIYRWYHPYKDSTVEFVSVSEQGLNAKDEVKAQWSTKFPGLQFADLVGAPPPAESARGRLSQMRSLAREFIAELTDKRGGDQVERELRLLDQPLYRFECPQRKVVDGGLFAFVEGTDPEAWLLFEAVAAEGGSRWRFALARMNIDPLRVRRSRTVVKEWSGLREAWSDRSQPYVMFNFDPGKLLTDNAAQPAVPRKETR